MSVFDALKKTTVVLFSALTKSMDITLTSKKGRAVLVGTFLLFALISYNLPEKYQLLNLIERRGDARRSNATSLRNDNMAVKTSSVKGEETTTQNNQGLINQTPTFNLYQLLAINQDRRGSASSLRLGGMLLTPHGELFLLSKSVVSDSIKRHTIKSINLATGSITSRTIKNHEVKSQDLARYLEIEHLTIKNELTVEDAINAEELHTETIDLGENTITDQNLTGDWNFNAGNLTTTGTLTTGAVSTSGNLDLQNNLVLNIGNANTDFTASGGLNLAGNLNISSNFLVTATTGAVTAGNITGGTYNGNTVTSGTGTLTLNSYTLALSNNAQLNQSLLTTSSPTFNTIYLTHPTNTATSVVTIDGAQTLTNKTITAGNNTISGLTNANLSGTAGITNANLQYSTISGIALGTNLATLTFGTHLTGTSYNGATNVTIATDATDANTVSTIVARDASGNFAANTITASLTGAASLNVLKSGDTMTGNLNLGANTLTTTNTTLISNLNADYLDGQHGSYYAPLANITGTTNYLAKFTGTNSVGSSNVYADGVNVGIGTTSPNAKLEITGGSLRLADSYNLQWGGGANYITGSNASNYLALTTNGNERLRIDSNGNVGIGTTSPEVRMQVVGQSGTGNIGVMNITGYDSSGQSLVMQLPSTGYTGNLIALMKAAGGSGQAMGFSTHFTADAVDRFSIMNHSGVENLTVLDSGNVGIGTTGPNTKLQVAGNIYSNSYLMPTASGKLWLDGGIATYISSPSANAISFVTGDGTPLYIQNGGNVGIGTTGPGSALHIYRNSGGSVKQTIEYPAAGAVAFTEYTNGTGSLWIGKERTSGGGLLTGGIEYAGVLGTTNSYPLQFFVNDSAKMTILNSGNVGIGTTGPGAKLTIQDISGKTQIGGSTALLIQGKVNASVVGERLEMNFNSYTNTTRPAGTIGFITTATDADEKGDLYFAVKSSTAVAYPIEAMRIQSGGNVGIGTTAPGFKLDVNGTIHNNNYIYSDNNGANNFVLNSAGTDYGFIQNDAADKWSLGHGTVAATLGTPVLTWTKAGNVGIGTTSPGALLEISKATAPSLRLSNLKDGGWVQDETMSTLEFYSGDPTSNKVIASIAQITDYAGSHSTPRGALQFKVTNDVGAGVFFEAMRIASSGNVGIGTTGPTTKLAVYDFNKTLDWLPNTANVSVVTTNAYAADLGGTLGLGGMHTDTTYSLFGAIAGRKTNATLGNNAGYLAFYASNGTLTERMRIQSDGNVGIGNTGPGARLHVTGIDDLSTSFAAKIGGATTTGLVITNEGNVGIGTTGPDVKLHIQNGDAGAVTLATGAVGVLESSSHTRLQLQSPDTYSPAIYFSSPSYPNSSYINSYLAAPGTSFLRFGLDGADVMTLNNGNVGIGTTSPAKLLDISGSNPSLRVSGTSATNDVAYEFRAGTSEGTKAAIVFDGLNYWGQGDIKFVNNSTADVSSYSVADDTRMIIKNNGNVGIGTTGPNGKLTIAQTGGQNFLTFVDTANSNKTGKLIYDNDYFSYKNNADDTLLWIASAGNVGIGTTGPGYLLDVAGKGSFAQAGGSAQVRLARTTSSVGEVWIGADNVGFHVFDSGFIERMAIASSTGNLTLPTGTLTVSGTGNSSIAGNVGIGTTSPGAALHLGIAATGRIGETEILIGGAGNAGRISYQTGSDIMIGASGSTAGSYPFNAAGHMILQSRGNQDRDIVFVTGITPTEKMVVKSGGNVGIGTTSPGNKLQVVDDTAAPAMVIQNSNAAGYGFLVDTYANSSAGEYIADFRSSSVSRLKITTSGNVGIGTTSPLSKLDVNGAIKYVDGTGDSNTAICKNSSGQLAPCSSLSALKNTVQDLGLGMETLMKLRPVKFIWNASGENDLGFIAEEVAAINPLLAVYSETGKLQGVKYPQLTSLLTSAVQQQQTQITGITENQNKIVNQLTGQLADQNLSVDNKLQLIGASLDELTTKQIEKLKDQIAAQTSDISTLQGQIADIQTNMYLERYDELWNFYQNFELEKVPLKNALENVFEGKIVAADIEALNKIKATDIEATNSLKGQNLELGAQVSGTGMIEAGKTEVVVNSPYASGTAKISLTPKGSTQGKNIFVDDITEGVSFKVKIDAPAVEKEINFYWFIIK